jgi:hypothetical protein
VAALLVFCCVLIALKTVPPELVPGEESGEKARGGLPHN